MMATPVIPATILVSYRDEGSGKGAFFDHWTIQNHTGFPTAAVHASIMPISDLRKFISTTASHSLPKSPVDPKIGRPVPPASTNYQEGGLLVIPGMTRESDTKQRAEHRTRMAFERTLIKDALNRGRPIVALCAGSWNLWQTLGGKLEDVTDHAYGGGMPRIGAKGNITHNVEIHDVVVDSGSLLQKMMGGLDDGDDATDYLVSVNSVHWKAPSATNIPENYQVVATSVINESIDKKTRQSQPMRPQENTVEAFESINGAPVVGFVWHPEANSWTDDNCHTLALRYLALAGNAFKARQKANQELLEQVAKVQENDLDDLADVFKKMRLS